MKTLTYATVLLLFISTSAFATALTCESSKDQRKLLITDVDKGCKLEYTKNGEVKEVATQKIGRERCEAVLKKIQGVLESNKFTCKE